MGKSALAATCCLIASTGYAQDKAEFQMTSDRFVGTYAEGDPDPVLNTMPTPPLSSPRVQPW
jgi:hypothetical protein